MAGKRRGGPSRPADQPASSAAANLRPIHPLVWTLLGAALLATVGLLMLEHPATALISLLVAVGAGAAALLQCYGGGRKTELDRRRFGRGPYVKCDATPNSDLLARLADIVRQLRDASRSENWAVDWASFDGLLAQSTTAARSGDLTAAARANLRAISSIMAQLRKQRPAGSDSGVFAF